MKQNLKYTDVFVPGGHPAYTYNPRPTLALEAKIRSAKENLCKLVVVTGHTKSGKTVLVKSIYPEDEAIWIDGGAVGNEEDLWSIVINNLELHQDSSNEVSDQLSAEVSAEAKAEGNILIAKGGAKLSSKVGHSQADRVSSSRSVSSRVTALTGLKKSNTALVIDDFHYLPKSMQGDIIRALKPLVFNGLPIIIIAIPHRRYDSVKVEREMTGRILSINVPSWSDEELKYIPDKGFALLDMEVSDVIKQKQIKESIGSPHLMQEFCRQMCAVTQARTLHPEEIDPILHRIAEEAIGRPIFDRLARGPRARSDRKQRKLKNGKTVDIYGLVLAGLAHLRPGLVTLEYEDLRAAIKEICIASDVPNVQEVARVLKQMAEISATDQSSTPVIDFDEDEKRLHVTDPFFAFYLRWGALA